MLTKIVASCCVKRGILDYKEKVRTYILWGFDLSVDVNMAAT